MQMYSKSTKKSQKCFFSFISQQILIWFALSGRAKFGTLNFYTELWDFATLINYGTYGMQIYSKNNTNCFFSLISLPIFIMFVLSDRARWGLQNLYTKFRNSLIMLIYANLFKITQKMLRTSFLNRFWFGLLYRIELIGASKFVHRIPTFINYANLCNKFMQIY